MISWITKELLHFSVILVAWKVFSSTRVVHCTCQSKTLHFSIWAVDWNKFISKGIFLENIRKNLEEVGTLNKDWIWDFSFRLNFCMPCLQETVPDGPVSWAAENQVSFIAEQVSHHPPSKYKLSKIATNLATYLLAHTYVHTSYSRTWLQWPPFVPQQSGWECWGGRAR